MEFIQPILLILHITGSAMGAGGAIATDATFIRSIWDRTMTSGQLKIIEIISKVVITGLVLLIVSGAALIYLNPHYFSIGDGNPVFWVKLTIVAILSLNGYAFHKLILPHLRAHADRNLATTETRNKLWLLALTGGLSGVSWYSTLALGVLMQVIEFPYLFLLNLYLLLAIGAIMSGYIMIYWILFSSLRSGSGADSPTSSSHNQDGRFRPHFKKTSHAQARIRPRGEAWRRINFLLIAIATFTLLIVGGYLIATNDRSNERSSRLNDTDTVPSITYAEGSWSQNDIFKTPKQLC